MENPAQEFIIRRQKSPLLTILAMGSFAALFCWVAVVLDSFPLLWALPIFLGLFGLWALLRTPRAILIRPQALTIELLFYVDMLAPRSKVSRFCDWSGIQSRIPTDDENQYVWLELINDSGDRLVLDTAAPEITNRSWKLSWEDFNEPEEIRLLREKMVAVTGVRDLGFRRPFAS